MNEIKRIDERGKACPLPVVETKRALSEMAVKQTVTVVDNEIAVQNLTKMANQLKYAVSSEKKAEREFEVTISKKETAENSKENCAACRPIGDTVVVLSSDKMGQGDDVLGGILIKSFLFSLTQLDMLPQTVIMYNGGVKLAVEGSPCLQDLMALAESGVEILACGTC